MMPMSCSRQSAASSNSIERLTRLYSSWFVAIVTPVASAAVTCYAVDKETFDELLGKPVDILQLDVRFTTIFYLLSVPPHG